MKTIKYILLILLLNSSILLMATTNQLYQTSSASYKSVGSGGVGSVGVVGESFRGSANTMNSAGAATSMATPMANFRSTSTMSASGTSLPNAAATGVVITSGETDSTDAPAGPRRVGPNTPPKDPFQDPLGDALLPLLLLVAGYGLFVARKRKAA